MSDAGADVLIVGAGPSGLFSALELARHGISSRVVDRELVPHHEARATALQPGTLEILSQAGVLEDALSASMHLAFARVFDGRLRAVAEVAFAGCGCRWEYQCSLPQWQTERILTDRLVALGGGVERGVTVTSLESRDGSILVTARRADGTSETSAVRWVIGAGGAHSVTRASLEAELAGGTYPGTALAADVQVSCPLPRDGSALIASSQGYVLLAPLPDERWISFVGDLDASEIEQLTHEPSAEAVSAAIGRRAGEEIRLVDIAWASLFRMHHRISARLAGERRFLLGDAGHLSSPFGGEGLNSGLQDAHNLAWKLSLELRGRARPGLLESFESERLAADRHVLEVSERLHQLAHGAVEAARTGARPAPPTREQVQGLVRSRSMLDVSYAGSSLVGEYLAPGQPPPDGPAPGERYPDRPALRGTRHHLVLSGQTDEPAVADVHDRWRGVLDVDRADTPGTRSGAILVRPDGHIGFRAVPADATGIGALDAHLNTYLIPA